MNRISCRLFANQRSGLACRARCAFTLVELVLALLVLSVIAVAVCTMTFGAMNDDRYLRSANLGQSEVEMAMRRIANNIREAQTGSITLGTSTLSTLTQADTAHGYASGATVAYSLQTDATISTQKDLMENDQRYGNNVLVHNVTTFNVTAVSGITSLYQVDLVAGSQPVSERHFQVLGRN